MKKLIVLLLFVYTTSNSQNMNFVEFVNEDYTQIGIWLDPVVWDIEGSPQIGIELQKIMHWGYAGISVSHISALTPPYTDLVGFVGINIHLFGYKPIRYYIGPRIGISIREGNRNALAGLMAGFDYRLNKELSKTRFSIGLRAWVDHREDQKNQFYGDSDAYDPGLIFTNPLSQENGAIVLSISW